ARDPALAEDGGRARSLEHARLEAAPAQERGQPLAARAHAFGILAHGIGAKKLEKALDDRAPLLGQPGLECLPLDGHAVTITRPAGREGAFRRRRGGAFFLSGHRRGPYHGQREARPMSLAFIVFLAGVAAIVIFAIVSYNRLVSLTQRAQSAWSDVDV